MKIGLFDSGIGGLTVLKALKEKYPYNEYIYYGDTLNVPYGNKTKDELLKLAKRNIAFLKKFNIDKIIIACGTVSSNCLNYLKENYNIKIQDIITPTIEYLNNSHYQNIGVIATSATINSHVFKNNINKNVYEIETPKLVPLIESNNMENIKKVLSEYLDKYIDKIDALVLGCTHYPIIKKYIASVLPKNIDIIDMSDLISIENNGTPKTSIYFSKLDDIIIKNVKAILNNNDIDINLSN